MKTARCFIAAWLCVTTLSYLNGGIMAATLEKLEVNGVSIPVIYEESKLLPVFSLKLIFRGGGVLGVSDSSQKDHASSIVDLGSALLEEGTKELGSVKFAQKLEENAIHITSSSGKESLSLSVSSLKEDAPLAIELLDSLMRSPNITESALDKVKEDAIAGILQKEADFDELASDEMDRLLFKGTPCAQIPTIESVQKVSLQDVQQYYQDHVVLSGLVILAGGDISFTELQKLLTPLLSSLKKGKEYPIKRCNVIAQPSTTLLKKPTQQAYVYFGSPFVMNDYAKEAHKMRVTAFVLGAGGFGSRLLEEVRVKRGLAYSAYWHAYNFKYATYGQGYLQTKLESKDEAIEVVKAVIEEFVKQGITQKELDSAKKFLLGSEPLRHESLSQRLSKAYHAYYFNQPLDSAKDELERIQALSLEEINEYIKSHKEILQMSFAIVDAE